MKQKLGKDKILKAALMLFVENGYHKTSISHIAKAANVSKGLTYNYFNSKEELLIAIIDVATQSMTEVADKMFSKPDYQETLGHFLEQYFLFLKENKSYLTFQLSLIFQPDLKKIVAAPLQRRAEYLLQQTITMFSNAGVDKPDLIARRFMTELDGIALHQLSIFKDYPLKEMHAQLFENYKDLNK